MDAINTDRPFFTVKVIPEGKGAQPIDLSDRVISFEFEDAEKKADKLTLKVDNFDLANFDDPVWKKGSSLEFIFGYPGRFSPPRRCVIQKVTGGRQLTVVAHAMSMLMHKVKRTRTWENMTLSQVATKIAGEYGEVLGVPGGTEAGNIAIDKALDQQVPHRHQAAQTDAEFLSRLARRHGLEFYVDSRGLHFKQRNMKQAPIKALSWYSGDGDFMDFDIDNDITRKPGAVTMKGFDPLHKKALATRADNDSTKRDGLAPVIEIVDPITGKSKLQKRAAEEDVGHSSETSAAGVKSHAEGKFREAQQVTIKLSGKLVGDPDIAGKRVIEIKGLGKRVSGRYYITTAVHKIDASYVTTFKSRTDGHGGYAKDNVGSKAAVNKKTEKPQQQIEVIDPRTGQASIQYRDSRQEEKH